MFFCKGAPDEDWIARVAANGWMALTIDRRILRNADQTRIVLDHGLGLFVLTGKRTHKEQGNIVAKVKPKRIRFVRHNHLPFIATITAGRSVTGMRPKGRSWNKGKYGPSAG